MLILVVAICVMPLYILLAWGCRLLTQRYLGTTPQYYFGASLLTGLGPPIILSIALVLLSTSSYNGFCYGFTDSQQVCSFSEFIGDQFFWSLFVIVPILMVSVPTSLVVFMLGWKKPS